MAKESLLTVTKRRLLGVVYLALIAALVALSIAIYQKKFTPVVMVSLKTDHTGNALMNGSDVKERGIIVGSVRSVHVLSGPDGGCVNQQVTCVDLQLALNPSDVDLIPANVSARILPKTIFGEQYVALQIPPNKRGHIAAGDTIPQDRSKGALETEKVLGDLLPLLQAVKPAELNATLTAIATALQGRGAELGNTLVQLDKYLRGLNPHAKQLVDDLGKLGRVSDEYNRVAPDLFATLDNLQTSAHTVIAERQQVSDLFDTTSSTSDVLRTFLAANEQRLITVNGTSAKVFGLLDEYSPESTCMFAALTKLYHLAASLIQNQQIRLSIVLDNNNLGPYQPGQQPFYVDGYGPSCFGLPNNPQPQVNGKFQIPPKYQCLNDGAPLTDNPCGQRKSSHQAQTDSFQTLGSRSENAVVSTLLSGTYHTTPNKVPPIATMLAAPLLRGTAVTVK